MGEKLAAGRWKLHSVLCAVVLVMSGLSTAVNGQHFLGQYPLALANLTVAVENNFAAIDVILGIPNVDVIAGNVSLAWEAVGGDARSERRLLSLPHHAMLQSGEVLFQLAGLRQDMNYTLTLVEVTNSTRRAVSDQLSLLTTGLQEVRTEEEEGEGGVRVVCKFLHRSFASGCLVQWRSYDVVGGELDVGEMICERVPGSDEAECESFDLQLDTSYVIEGFGVDTDGNRLHNFAIPAEGTLNLQGSDNDSTSDNGNTNEPLLDLKQIALLIVLSLLVAILAVCSILLVLTCVVCVRSRKRQRPRVYRMRSTITPSRHTHRSINLTPTPTTSSTNVADVMETLAQEARQATLTSSGGSDSERHKKRSHRRPITLACKAKTKPSSLPITASTEPLQSTPGSCDATSHSRRTDAERITTQENECYTTTAAVAAKGDPPTSPLSLHEYTDILTFPPQSAQVTGGAPHYDSAELLSSTGPAQAGLAGDGEAVAHDYEIPV